MFSSFSFSIFLLLREEYIFLLQIFSFFSFSVILSPWKSYFLRVPSPFLLSSTTKTIFVLQIFSSCIDNHYTYTMIWYIICLNFMTLGAVHKWRHHLWGRGRGGLKKMTSDDMMKQEEINNFFQQHGHCATSYPCRHSKSSFLSNRCLALKNLPPKYIPARTRFLCYLDVLNVEVPVKMRKII